jgi:hypothetical protein
MFGQYLRMDWLRRGWNIRGREFDEAQGSKQVRCLRCRLHKPLVGGRPPWAIGQGPGRDAIAGHGRRTIRGLVLAIASFCAKEREQ